MEGESPNLAVKLFITLTTIRTAAILLMKIMIETVIIIIIIKIIVITIIKIIIAAIMKNT